MPYIFLDESGQFSKHNHENYFVIASFAVDEPRRTSKRFRAWLRNHLPKKMKDQSEIKWSSRLEDELRLKTLDAISRLGVQIRFLYFHHSNIPLEYRRKNKVRGGFLYTYAVSRMCTEFLPIADKELRIFCDQRRLSSMTETEFSKELVRVIAPQLPKDVILQIEMVDSVTSTNIQIADWIAGALARYLEHGHLGEDFFNILKSSIIGLGVELFN